MVAQDTASV